MANGDILITPVRGTGSDPTIKFTGPAATTSLTLRSLINGTTTALSFEGSVGQLLSITDSMTGSIYSVNDISGIPSIEVLDTGLVKLNEYNGNLQVGGATNLTGQVLIKGTNDTSSLVTGAVILDGGMAVSKGLNVGGVISASRNSTGTGYFGLGTTLSSGAAANDTSLRWDGTGGKLNFSFGTAIVGSITNAGVLTTIGTIESTGGTIKAATLTAYAAATAGLALWNSAPASFGINMAAGTDATYGGRISGETTSDYNMYLTMNMSGGTNRGFVFRNAYATPLFAVNPDGVRSNVPITFSNSSAVSAAGTVQGDATVLTASTNNVTTVAASSGVRLPTTAAGLRIVVRNGGANALKVYPSGSTTINAGGASVAYSLDVGAMIEFIAMSATNWYTLNGTYV